jgi:hypothetical protein
VLRESGEGIEGAYSIFKKTYELGKNDNDNLGPLTNLVDICLTMKNWAKSVEFSQKSLLISTKIRQESIFYCISGYIKNHLLDFNEGKNILRSYSSLQI